MGKLGGRKYRKQFLSKKEGGDWKSEWHRASGEPALTPEQDDNAPKDLDEEVNGLVVGARGGGVGLNANAV